MSNKANSSTQKSYYLPGDPSRTPVSHEMFNSIMRPYWKLRKQLQRTGECNAPAWHVCMCDCCDCPYRRCGDTIAIEALEETGAEVPDPRWSEDKIADRIFEKEIYRCLPQMDTIDRIIIRCMVLHERDVTERQLAALISKAIGQPYSHQSVHKRIPAAAKRLARLMDYNPYE